MTATERLAAVYAAVLAQSSTADEVAQRLGLPRLRVMAALQHLRHQHRITLTANRGTGEWVYYATGGH